MQRVAPVIPGMSFQNLYYKRTAGTAKACYVCYRPTTTVLATINTTDFVYACPGHLTDPNFASQVKDNGAPAKAQVSADEIARVKAEWEEKQKRKKEKEKEAAKAEKEKKDEEKKDGEKKDEEKENKAKEKAKEKSPVSPVKTPPTPGTPSSSHERYILHRDFFAMRQGEHRKRRQTAQAKELAPRLPGAPGGGVV